MFKFIKYRKDIRRLKFLYNQIFAINMLRRGAEIDIGEPLLEDLKQYEEEYEKLKNRLVSKFFL